MNARIRSLVDRLPQLDEEERSLRQEANTCAFPVLDGDNQVKMEIINGPRLSQIREELDGIAEERQIVTGKLDRLKQIPTAYWPDEDHHIRRRREYASRFYHKILIEGQRAALAPDEGISDPRYAALKAEFEPEFEAYRTQLKRAKEYQTAVDAILAE